MKSARVYGAVSGGGIGTGFSRLCCWAGLVRALRGFRFGSGKPTPGLADRPEQFLNLDQRPLKLREVGFAETIDHITVEAGEWEADHRGGLVIECPIELPYNLHRLGDCARPLGNTAVFQMPARIPYRLNGAFVSEMNELQRARGLDRGFQIGVVVVAGHDSLTDNVSDAKPRSSVFMKHLLLCAHLTLVSVIGTNVLASPQQNTPPEKEEGHAAVVADHHASSVEAMRLSIDKQKAAARLQVGEGGVSASFFTTPWTAPQVIVPPPQCAPIAESDLTPRVSEAALAQDVSPGLIRAVIRQESASFPCAVSGKGAVGLMQLMPDTAQQFGSDPFDAKQNVQAGSKHLKQLLTRYKGDTRLALAAYNAGADRVDAAGGIPAIPETAAYVEAILKELESNIGSVSVDKKPE